MGTIVITSRLDEDFREDLEQILFFNPKQHQATSGIKHCVEHYGLPEITNEQGYLRIRLNSTSLAQTLYCVDRTESKDSLAGVIVFMRNNIEDMSILYIAIAKNQILRGPIITARLAWDLVHQVIESASFISGVKNVRLDYTGSVGKNRMNITSIPVNRHRHKQPMIKQQSENCPDEAITCYEYQRCFNCKNKGIMKIRKPLNGLKGTNYNDH